jgi:hypothetical protein
MSWEQPGQPSELLETGKIKGLRPLACSRSPIQEWAEARLHRALNPAQIVVLFGLDISGKQNVRVAHGFAVTGFHDALDRSPVSGLKKFVETRPEAGEKRFRQ